MKLLNYDIRFLIMENLKKPVLSRPDTYTKRQIQILSKIIVQRKIKKEFFDFLIMELYGLNDWKKMDYKQMYDTIHILSNWNNKKGKNYNEYINS